MAGAEKKKRMTSRTRNRYRWIGFFIALVMIVYFTFALVNLRIQINHASTECDMMEEKVYTQREKTADYKRIADAVSEVAAEKKNLETGNTPKKVSPETKAAYSDYIEKIARENLDYVKNGEIVYINIAGH